MTNEEAVKKYKELMAFVNDHKEVIERIREDSMELARFCMGYGKSRLCRNCPFNRSTNDLWNCSMILPFEGELGGSSNWAKGVFEKEYAKRKH